MDDLLRLLFKRGQPGHGDDMRRLRADHRFPRRRKFHRQAACAVRLDDDGARRAAEKAHRILLRRAEFPLFRKARAGRGDLPFTPRRAALLLRKRDGENDVRVGRRHDVRCRKKRRRHQGLCLARERIHQRRFPAAAAKRYNVLLPLRQAEQFMQYHAVPSPVHFAFGRLQR